VHCSLSARGNSECPAGWTTRGGTPRISARVRGIDPAHPGRINEAWEATLRNLRIIATGLFALIAVTTPVSAQSFTAAAPATSIEVVSGVMDFDFQGTGKTMPLAIRASRGLTGGLSLEVGTTFARPDQSFGRSTFAAPEATLQDAWRLGRVHPFVAGGGGLSATTRPLIGADWRMTLLAGGGARVDLTDRVYAVGEMRLRGVSRTFGASTAEWLGGIGWRLF
jgi:hypothetical protein